MSWTEETIKTIRCLDEVKRVLKESFVDREMAVDLLVLATVCHEHLLLIGSPGTAKTRLVTDFTQMVDANCFHYLLTRFTEPSELFGPLDLEQFQKGTYHIRTQDMLPEAQVAFLDEVFQASSAILNALLALVNERIFHNGSLRQRTPLLTLVGASNHLPDDPWLQAFADRFALRLHIDPVDDAHLENLITQGWHMELQRIAAEQQDQALAAIAATVRIDQLKALNRCLTEVNIDQIKPIYAAVVRELRAEGIDISDRRVVKGLKLIAGSTLLREAAVAEVQDLWPLNFFWSRPEEAETARSVIQPRIEEAGGPSLTRARAAEDIMDDIETLQQRQETVKTEIALGAHLMALNRIRQEILKSHRNDVTLKNRIDSLIQDNLGRLENLHV